MLGVVHFYLTIRTDFGYVSSYIANDSIGQSRSVVEIKVGLILIIEIPPLPFGVFLNSYDLIKLSDSIISLVQVIISNLTSNLIG